MGVETYDGDQQIGRRTFLIYRCAPNFGAQSAKSAKIRWVLKHVSIAPNFGAHCIVYHITMIFKYAPNFGAIAAVQYRSSTWHIAYVTRFAVSHNRATAWLLTCTMCGQNPISYYYDWIVYHHARCVFHVRRISARSQLFAHMILGIIITRSRYMCAEFRRNSSWSQHVRHC